MATSPTPELDPARRASRWGEGGAAALAALAPVGSHWGGVGVAWLLLLAAAAYAAGRVRGRRLAGDTWDRNRPPQTGATPRPLTLWWAAVYEGLADVQTPPPPANAGAAPPTVRGYRRRPEAARAFRGVALALVGLVWASATLREAGDSGVCPLLIAVIVALGLRAAGSFARLAGSPPPPDALCLEATSAHLAVAWAPYRNGAPQPPAPWDGTPVTMPWKKMERITLSAEHDGHSWGAEMRFRVFGRASALKPILSTDLRRIDVDLGALVGAVQRYAPHVQIQVSERQL